MSTNAELIQQGLIHHRAGQIGPAMDRYTEVLRNDPRDADALYYIAMIACQDGQYDKGIELARRALAFKPGQARAHILIGQALHRQGKIADA
ncbi:MAG TPA: tetratricopeptide repeat protein, partial [Stellaceae bacterium]|nr:tetratricopeptide repeat protein [Stellaceae bacterium]